MGVDETEGGLGERGPRWGRGEQGLKFGTKLSI